MKPLHQSTLVSSMWILSSRIVHLGEIAFGHLQRAPNSRRAG